MKCIANRKTEQAWGKHSEKMAVLIFLAANQRQTHKEDIGHPGDIAELYPFLCPEDLPGEPQSWTLVFMKVAFYRSGVRILVFQVASGLCIL